MSDEKRPLVEPAENIAEIETETSEEVTCIIEPLDKEIPTTKKYTFWRMFSETVKRHRRGDVSHMIVSGTGRDNGKILPPQPWLFARVFLLLVAAFVLLYFVTDYFGIVLTYPALVLFGSLAIPLTLLTFFFEINVTRDVSIFSVMKMFFCGAVVAIILKFFLTWMATKGISDYLTAVAIGAVQEIVRVALIWLLIKRYGNGSVFSGILVGASVGAGFAAFEASATAFSAMFIGLELPFDGQQAISVIVNHADMISQSVRGLVKTAVYTCILVPSVHILWGAIFGASILMVQNSRKGAEETIKSFYLLFLIPIVLHSVWHMPFVEKVWGNLYFIPVVILLFSWYVITEIINYALSVTDFEGGEKERQG